MVLLRNEPVFATASVTYVDKHNPTPDSNLRHIEGRPSRKEAQTHGCKRLLLAHLFSWWGVRFTHRTVLYPLATVTLAKLLCELAHQIKCKSVSPNVPCKPKRVTLRMAGFYGPLWL